MPIDILSHPKTDEEILEKVKEFRRVGSDASSNQYDRMRLAEDFVRGDQWDSGVRAQAELDGKFTLTIPIIKPQINQISGSEIQNPQDFIVKNTQGGAATIARVLTALVKQVADSEQSRYEKSDMFKAGISSGQGCMGVFLDKTDDPKHANLIIQKLNEHHCLFDPNAEAYDINRKGTGGQYVIWDEPVPKEELEAEYPTKKEELVAGGSISIFGVVAGNVKAIVNWAVHGDRGYSNDGLTFGSNPRGGNDNLEKTRYWKTHTFWKEYKECIQWYDNRKTELESLFLCRPEEIKAAKAITKENPDVFSIEKVNSFIMHHTITANDVFLEDRIDELKGVQMFPIVPFWPYFINGYKSGIAEDLIGTQQEINWTHSMALNQVKQGSYPPVIIKEDATGDMADELRNILQGSKRAVINAADYGGDVEFTPQPQYPTAEVFTQQAMNNIKTITGRLDIPEANQKSLSGKAKIVDVQKTQQGSMNIFSNYNYSLAILGNLIVDCVRNIDIFSEDEIRATVDGDDLIDAELMEQAKQMVLQQLTDQGAQIPDPPTPPNAVSARQADPAVLAKELELFQSEMAAFQEFVEGVEAAAVPIAQDLLIALIHNMKVGKYNTKITMSPMSETMRMVKSEEIFGLHQILRESGDVGLDPDDLIEATDVANKEQLKAGREKKLAAISTAQQDESLQRTG